MSTTDEACRLADLLSHLQTPVTTQAAVMLHGQAEQIERLKAERDVYRAERDQARARVDASVKILTGIHSLLYPPLLSLPDGRVMAFRPKSPDPHEILQALSDCIRALPDELTAERDALAETLTEQSQAAAAARDRLVHDLDRVTAERDSLQASLTVALETVEVMGRDLNRVAAERNAAREAQEFAECDRSRQQAAARDRADEQAGGINAERECCGTLRGSHHRSTCEHYKPKSSGKGRPS